MTDTERIIELLKWLNISARELSKQLNLRSPQIFYDIKAGKCGISKELAAKIQERYLNINKSWLLTGEGEMFVQPQTANNTINNSGDFCENVIGGDLKQQLAELINIQKKFQDMISVKDKQINELIEILKDKKK